MIRHLWAGALAVLAFTSLPVVLVISGQARNDQQHALCVDDQRQWDTLHKVIEAAAKPSADGTSLDHLVIPADTPASVIEILRQLTVSEAHLAPSSEVLSALGPRPSC